MGYYKRYRPKYYSRDIWSETLVTIVFLPFKILYSLFELIFKKKYGIKSKTFRGERVRSKGEKQIADCLYQHGIKYRYEPKLLVGGWFSKKKPCMPDFYLPKYNVYIEYWGLAKKSAAYRHNMKKKMKQYQSGRVKVISIYPKDIRDLEWAMKRQFEDLTGQNFPGKR